MASPENLATCPDPCPTSMAGAVETLNQDVLAILKQYRLPWAVMAILAKQHYKTLDMLADCWPDESTARVESIKDLGLKADLGYSDEECKLTSIRIMQACRSAKQLAKEHYAAVTNRSDIKADLIITPGQRESMEAVYQSKTGRKPKLQHQGANQFLGHLYKEISKGRIGHFDLSKIVPYLQDPTHPTKTKHGQTTDDDGYYKDNATEFRDEPQTEHTWKNTLEVFKTSLLMCIWSNPDKDNCLLYTSPSPRDGLLSRMPSSA